MKKDRRIIDSYETDVAGQKVTVKVGKSKEKKKKSNRPKNVTNCPECNSTLTLNSLGVWECTGDQLSDWSIQFRKYSKLNDSEKVDYLKSVSNTGRFEYLYGRWELSQELEEQPFECGYSNKMHLPLPNSKTKLPDPIFIKHLERKLGRNLTEEEKAGEHDLWFYQGQYLTKKKKGAKKVKIPLIVFPNDVTTRSSL